MITCTFARIFGIPLVALSLTAFVFIAQEQEAVSEEGVNSAES